MAAVRAEPLRVSVLISGRGSNMLSLIEAFEPADAPAQVVGVVSNVPGTPGLARARAAGIATEVIDHRRFEEREAFEAALTGRLAEAGTELVCLAGFMRLLTAGFVARWRDRLINVHPSLLPAFKGLDVHERVLRAGVRFTGCTVHYVRPAMDDGPVLVQAVVPVHADDDPERLAARVLAQEHVVYPRAVRLIAEGRVRIVGERARIDGAAAPDGALINPV